MVASRNYKKYMKDGGSKDYSLLKLFAISFFGMLFVFTYLIKSFTPSVDVSIGDNQQETVVEPVENMKSVVDQRLAMIQEEDQGRNFSELMKNPDDVVPQENKSDLKQLSETVKLEEKTPENQYASSEPLFKVFIGTYTSAEQAKVAKDIIAESGSNLNPIVKCIGSNNYTLQVGIFKSKASAESLLFTIQQNHLPGRIVQEF